MSAPNAAISPLIKVIIWSPPYLQNDCWQSLDLLMNGNELVCTVHHNYEQFCVHQTARWSALIAGIWWGNKRFKENKVVEDEVRLA